MKVPTLILLILVSLVSSCGAKSNFISDCKCNKIITGEGVEVIDHLNRYKVVFPTKTWEPNTHTDELGNGIIGALLTGNSFKSFGVVELRKANNWMNKQHAQADIEAKFNVTESGFIKINGVESLWNLVDFKNDSVPVLSLYITTEHPQKDFFYTLNLSVSKDKYGKKELCELAHLLWTFQTL